MAQAAPKRSLSVLKRTRQAEKRSEQNKAVRSELKTLSKKLAGAVDTKDREQVEKALRQAVKAYGSAASKGVIHRNTASRNISRLSKLADKVLKAEAA
ncbi:MAG: 30S ribosomal protein S20 [Nitrospirota bacterium]